MPNPPSKKTPSSPTAKPASASAASKPANALSALHKAEDTVRKNASTTASTATNAAAKTTRPSSENVVNLGQATAKGMIDTTQAQTQKIKEKTAEYAKAGAAQFSSQANKASRAMSEMSSIGQIQMDALMECGTIAADLTKELSEELFTYANQSFSNSVEISKDIFSCRTMGDMFDLQNKMIKSSLDRFFSESSKISEMVFSSMNRASEPLGECFQNTTERLNRSLAA